MKFSVGRLNLHESLVLIKQNSPNKITLAYQRLRRLQRRPARSMEACPVWAAGGAIGPGQAAVLGGALLCPVLLTPQLTADIAVRDVGAKDELLSKNLLALLVKAVLCAWQLPRQGQGTLRDIQQTVPCG